MSSRPQHVRRSTRLAGSLAALLCATLVLGIPAVAAAPPDLPPNTLFALERSLNANIVVYEAKMNGDGTFVEKDPVEVYWIRLADNGQREDLNFLERTKAYGVKITTDGNGTLKMIMKALPKRPMRIVAGEGKPKAMLTLSGKEAVLKRVYVKSGDGLLSGPEYVDLFGVTREGTEISERIIP